MLGLIVLPHGKRRSRNNNYYACTKIAFHGISAGNFWWRNNVGAARTNPNLYQVFIIVLQSLWFCAFASWDSQVKTSFWLMKLRKNQGKIVKCLLFQPSLDCCQEHECSHKVQELSSLALKVSHKQKIIVFETFWSNHFFTSNVIKCENWKSWSSGAQGVPFKQFYKTLPQLHFHIEAYFYWNEKI